MQRTLMQANNNKKPDRADGDRHFLCLSIANELSRVVSRMYKRPCDLIGAYATVSSVALRLEQMIRREPLPGTRKSWAVARDDTGWYFAFIGREGSSWVMDVGKATLFACPEHAAKAALACHVEAHAAEVEVQEKDGRWTNPIATTRSR